MHNAVRCCCMKIAAPCLRCFYYFGIFTWFCICSSGVYILFPGQGVCAFIWRDRADIAAPPRDGPQVQPMWQWTQGHNSALWGTRDPRATSQLEGSSRGCKEGGRYPLLRLQSESRFYKACNVDLTEPRYIKCVHKCKVAQQDLM